MCINKIVCVIFNCFQLIYIGKICQICHYYVKGKEKNNSYKTNTSYVFCIKVNGENVVTVKRCSIKKKKKSSGSVRRCPSVVQVTDIISGIYQSLN